MTEKHFLLVDDHGQTYRNQLEMLLENKDVTIHLIEAFDKNFLDYQVTKLAIYHAQLDLALLLKYVLKNGHLLD